MGAKAPFFFARGAHTLDGVMGVNGVFCVMLLSGLVYAAATGRLDAAQRALDAGCPRNEVYRAKLKLQDMFEEE